MALTGEWDWALQCRVLAWRRGRHMSRRTNPAAALTFRVLAADESLAFGGLTRGWV